jgi:glycerophosphoryl diester phosphodiesterase
VGHRGALYQHLENTLPGFQYCLEIQCDAVELDVYYLPLCDELVVFHGGGTDEIPGDLTDYCVNPPKRSILELSWDEVQQLQFNPNYPELVCPKNDEFNNAKIPTLRQVLELYRGKNIVVKIELKGPDTTLPVLKLVEELDMVSQCHFSSFHHDRLQHIRHLHPERHANGTHVYQTGALFFEPVPEDFVEQALKVGASEVHLRYDTCTLPRIHAIHEAGMTSMAWLRGPLAMMPCSDVQEEDLYRTLLETGVQQLCCNRPDVLLRVLGRL